MPSPHPTSQPQNPQSEADPLSYTTSMRIFGGVAWGTLTMLVIASILIVLPQVPRPWLWGILPGWGVLCGLGILLQWSIARGPCPQCGHPMVVPVMGKRCPSCRSYLKAVNRTIVKAI